MQKWKPKTLVIAGDGVGVSRRRALKSEGARA
jgi:hypothetical protein